MTINPKDYDLEELRKMARKRESSDGPVGDEESRTSPEPEPDPADIEWGSIDETEDSLAGDSFRARLYRELLPVASSHSDIEKPYLPALPETKAAEFLIFEWLEFLLLHGGFKGATEALKYYEDIGWITESVESDLSDYLLGIDEPATEGTELDVDDHLLSLVYVAKLVSMR